MKAILKALALAAATLPCAALADSVPLKLSDGWTKSAWAGCEAEEVPLEGSQKALILKTSEKGRPWCGVGFFTAVKSSDSPVAVKLPASLKDAFLCFKVNGSEDEFGRHAGGQGLQISVGEKVADSGEWEKRFVKGQYVPVSGFIEGVKSVDNDPSTWQSVRIPLEALLRDRKVEKLGYIAFQYVKEPPGAGIMIKDICLETPGN